MGTLKTIILAAGKGTRFKSVLPKVLHELAGKPIVHYVLDVAERVGSLEIFVVVGHQAEQVVLSVSSRAKTIVQKEQLGTAHAVQCCCNDLKDFDGDVLVMCGDTPLLDEAIVQALIKQHREQKNACTVLTVLLTNPFGYGRILRDTSGALKGIKEEKDATAIEKQIKEINTGVYCFNSKLLFSFIHQIKENANKKEFYLTDIIELFLKEGHPVSSYLTDDAYANLGINSRVELAQAQQIRREKVLKRYMESGVTIVDPQTTYIEENVVIGQDTIIYPCTYIHAGVVIGQHCSLGPFARLRPGTKIGDFVSIGNFTEVSRSVLADHVNMKHFSFLGDTEVGEGANIGCGTVTANYDGKHKNKTKIGKKAFIGCDTVLVAPVEVGDGAMAGAGSVVARNKNIPSGMLAVGMPARVIKKVNKHE